MFLPCSFPRLLATACYAILLLLLLIAVKVIPRQNNRVRGLIRYQAFLFDPLRTIPGPWHAKFTNLRLKVAVVTGKRIYYVQSLHDTYGPIVRISPSEVSVNNAQAFKEIHRAGSGFNKSPWYQEFNFGEAGIFAMSDPKQHAQRRKFFARSFSKSFLRQNWESVILEKVRLAISQIKREGKNGATVNVMKWWMFLATDVSVHLMFGESFRTLESGQKSSYTRTLEGALKGFGIQVELPTLVTVAKRLPFRATNELFNADSVLMEYGKIAVENSKRTDSKANMFASMIAETEHGATDRLTETDVSLEATNLIIAGSDTTGITLTYLTWAVLQRPELRKQVELEVQCLSDSPTDEDLEKLPLLNGVIEETLRLYGAAPGGLPRVVPRNGADLLGHHLPSGTIVSTQAYSLHRDPNNFHHPEDFDPNRWLSGKMSDSGKAAYSPFGAGARICLGIHLARMELRLAAALFFKELTGAKIASSMRPKDMIMENFFLVAPKSHKCEIVL